MSNKVKFKWKDVEQKLFGEIKRIVTQNTLLVYPYFNKSVDIHTYDSYFQIVSVIIQDGKPIAFYRLKITGPQTWYTVTENNCLV